MKPWFEQVLTKLKKHRRLWLGAAWPHGIPITMPVDAMMSHMVIAGGTKSGKSAFIMRLMSQLAQHWVHVHFVNQKDDTYEHLHQMCERPLKWYSDRIGLSSYPFNVFRQGFMKRRSHLHRALWLGKALGMAHGLSEYGKEWFTGAALNAQMDSFERNPDPKNFGEMYEDVKRYVTAKNSDMPHDLRAAASNAMITLRRLAAIEPLNDTTKPGIDIEQTFFWPGCTYWGLNSGISYDMATAQANLILHAIHTTATELTGKRKIPVIVIVDEAEKMNGIKLMLQGRSLGVGYCLSLQSLEALEGKDYDYRDVVETNCGVSINFRPSKAEQLRIVEASGTSIEELETRSTSWNGQTATTTTSYSQFIAPRLNMNEVSAFAADPHYSFITFAEDEEAVRFAGQTVVMESDFHIEEELYRAWCKRPWPDGNADTITPENPPPPPQPQPLPVRPPRNSPPNPRRQQNK